MNVFNSNDDTSGFLENIVSTIIFYDSPHNLRKSMIVGWNAQCSMAKSVNVM